MVLNIKPPWVLALALRAARPSPIRRSRLAQGARRQVFEADVEAGAAAKTGNLDNLKAASATLLAPASATMWSATNAIEW